MIKKMLDSTRSSHIVASIYDNDFPELVWEKGEVVVRGGSSNRKRKSNKEERTLHEDEGSITKRTRLNTLYSLEQNFPPQRDSGMSSSHQSNGQDHSCQSSQSKSSGKLNEEFANLLKPVKDSMPVITTGNNTQLLQQCLPSSPQLKKQRTDSTKTPTPKVNFSNFSIPAVFLKSTTTSTTNYQGNSATQQTKSHSSLERVEEIETRRQIEIKPAKESQGFQKLTSLTVERSTKPTPPPVDDQNSEAVGYNRGVLEIHRSQGQQQLRCDQTPTSEALGDKGQAYNNSNMCHEPMLASSSVCSLGASNDPNLGIRKYEDTDDSTYLSDNDGEPEDREGGRVRRSRNAEVHNLSEKKRREKINKKMRTLKELIPNCNKVDKASMLDDAIDYLKTLKLQLQIMSLGSGLWPLMMLPAHHMNGPHLPQLGMGFRPPQLPIPPLSAITDNRLQMFGFPNQIPSMPMPHAPFFPITGNSATQPHLAEHLTNNSAASLNVSLPNNMNMDTHDNIAKKLAPSHVSFPHHITSTPIASPFIVPQK